MGDGVADPELLLERVQELSEAVEELGDPRARLLASDLVSTVVAMYGDGLERIVAAIAESGAPGAAILDRLAADGAVSSLLLIHDLYPVDLHERVLEALDTVRPYMESHGGNVELVELRDGVARLALQGSCNGCAASRATLETAIEQALEEHAPDLAGLVAALRAGGGEVADRPAGAAWHYEGSGDSLIAGNRLALEGLEETPTEADVSHARIEGRAVIHPTAVLDRVHIRGPAWIGPRAVLVDAFVGPYTSVGEGARIEGAEVEHALLLPGAWIRHLDRRLESSVIGRDARVVREFSVPANVRLRVGRGAEVALS